jgi:hypothetical protein
LSPPAPAEGLPELRIVARAELLLHEEADERRVAALVRRMDADETVKNPPIVTPLGADRFVVLDGANRSAALARLGVPDVGVQVVDYGSVSLSTWFHLVVGVTPAEMLAAVRAVPGLLVEDAGLARARRGLAERRSLAFLSTPDGAVHELAGGADPAAQAELLRRVVATYKGQGHIHRVQSDDIAALRPLYSEIAGLVVFPGYSPADILAIAGSEAKLPSGITRHLIPHRALRLNLPLDVLWADTPRSEKNRWLGEWVRGKLQAGHVRAYEEPTVLFDE